MNSSPHGLGNRRGHPRTPLPASRIVTPVALIVAVIPLALEMIARNQRRCEMPVTASTKLVPAEILSQMILFFTELTTVRFHRQRPTLVGSQPRAAVDRGQYAGALRPIAAIQLLNAWIGCTISLPVPAVDWQTRVAAAMQSMGFSRDVPPSPQPPGTHPGRDRRHHRPRQTP